MSTDTCVVRPLLCEVCAPWNACDDDCRESHELLARLLERPEGHAAWHRANQCRNCGASKRGVDGHERATARLCRSGRCTEWHCPNCDAEWGSVGPVNCPCSASWWTRMWRWLRGR